MDPKKQRDQDIEIFKVLSKYNRIAVVGLSPDPTRPSFGVSQYMQSQGYKITPIRPLPMEIILDEQSKPSLKDISDPIEIVNVFRRGDAVPQVVKEAIDLGAKVLWLQEGVTHPVAERLALEAGLLVFSDLCILKEHRRLFKKP